MKVPTCQNNNDTGEPPLTDADGDGFPLQRIATIRTVRLPCATEVANDGIDQDCNGQDYTTNTTESICDDGADNDQDGQYDCNDTDCVNDPTCARLPCAATPAQMGLQ